MLGQAKAVLHGALGFTQRVLDQDITESGNFACGFGQRGDPQHVAKHYADILAALEPAQEQGHVAFQGTGTKAGKGLRKFVMGKTLVELLFAQEGLQ